MSTAWSGLDPTQAADPASYELGVEYEANDNITVTAIRIWEGATPGDFANRKGRIWSLAGAVLATADMPTTMPSGWTEHDLATPLDIASGTKFMVSYSTGGNYGESNGALDSAVVSSDGSVTALAAADGLHGNGAFTTTPTDFPDHASTNDTFYGIDFVYTLTGGNTAPEITDLAVTLAGPDATAVITAADDQTLVGATYTVDWGDGTDPASSSSATGTHTYAETGTYAVLATVADADGLTDSKAVAVSVDVLGTNPRYATTAKVAVEWLTQCGFAAGMELPEDTSTWSASGFITPYATGGSSNIDIQLVQPVLTLKCWAVSPDTGQPPWNLATNLAEAVRTACFARTGMDAWLVPDHCDQKARVLSAYLVAEPRRSWADDGDYAAVVADLRLHWIVQSS